jgi:hypothetical protein
MGLGWACTAVAPPRTITELRVQFRLKELSDMPFLVLRSTEPLVLGASSWSRVRCSQGRTSSAFPS